MVAGYHLIWTAYGWWLPNDPRGSMSRAIQCDVIAELGELHYGRKKIQPSSREIREFYDVAKKVLAFELCTFTDEEVLLLADSFAKTIEAEKYTCYACAIMFDHVHMLIRRHRDHAEDMIEKLQTNGRHAMLDAGKRGPDHPVWGGPGWKVFLNNIRDFERTIFYIEQNPIKAKQPPQIWPFVKKYDGWLPRPAWGNR